MVVSPSERLLIVGSRGAADPAGRLAGQLRSRYPDWRVSSCHSYLSGIGEAARHGASAVLAYVDPSQTIAPGAVAGLREAAGPEAKVVLCCPPESEPVARRLLVHGADDYVLYPLDGRELDAAIGYTRLTVSAGDDLTPAPAASMEELSLLGEALCGLEGSPRVLLERLTGLVRKALSARGARIEIDGASAQAGDQVVSPVLSAPIRSSRGLIGRVMLAARSQGPYSAGDVEKLNHYASLLGHVVEAATRQRRWAAMAVTDETSGLFNRRYFHQRLDEILVRAANEQLPVTVLLFDVDDFKTYNDTYGHDAGDEIIRETGELFRRHCRQHDVVARYGGDEFAVIFWDPHGPRAAGSRPPQSAMDVLDRFTDALRSHRFSKLGPSGAGKLTISGGLATFPWDGGTREELIRRADHALLSAKRTGKNRILLIGEGGTESQRA